MSTLSLRLGAVALALFAATGCTADQPTAIANRSVSAPTAPSQLVSTATASLVSVKGLERAIPLGAPASVSKLIGVGGGTLTIPTLGVTVSVPAGALAAPTTLTITARPGSLVAYDFAPHGITFAKPLVFTQRLNGTKTSLLNVAQIQLGYYKDASLLTGTGASVSELLGGTVNMLTWSFTANIKHFSGYIVTCGRNAD